ncbi:MAG: hypothetical protein UU73_C0003G0277 [Candidatus Daviesbacteria bacterium GW2011_GWA1_41_61]|uniref:Uncharacterized protein n=1 Tax=Candidatus Daviesbacteria bacterium GW2011_GWA2_40_9 TaxID=1618424 RepID=A0A0G0U672_9BACT|nr:MAG: hypothetical protein UU26_C0004G0005 [Candidatus Daviesbacteria bacterium GW2011_GWC1_40_9]KKR82671.1 MAG: hypothetical protein UU29_C0010G0017 [Candidatus Daviesbacteria bacterium GW2011_GWA2_40_9]KKR93373.1 MAG: hypothetical protein UU44_C0002G0034 [Candidatus Daviesbacteria bacterium GW2011_GWB1_41_15]KKS15078.1 MAG: hypothetical protein UU73_C0003G0277 [Candidatus Daviesbacteria bacterium GW2011_GWA1_41_61]
MSPQILIVLILFTLIVISAAYLNQTAGFRKELSPSPVSPTVTPNNQGGSDSNISGLKYPNSRNIINDQNQQAFISFDDPQVITDWYKEKIKALGMNTTSFVQTKTNGDVLNKLVGSRGQQKVEVEIIKNNREQEVKIKLNVNS